MHSIISPSTKPVTVKMGNQKNVSVMSLTKKNIEIKIVAIHSHQN